MELKFILESLLMSHTQPLTLEQMQGVFDEPQKPSRGQLEQALGALAEDYAGRAIELKTLASGYCFRTKSEYKHWITQLLVEKPVKYSQALLETLAIIAYRQPVTRAEIEDIRGVAVSSAMLKTLLEREWVRVAGYREVPGKPAMYATTKEFLDYFNLKNLSELPRLFSETQAAHYES